MDTVRLFFSFKLVLCLLDYFHFRLEAGARRTHKGPQSVPGGKKKVLRGAQLRRECWLGNADAQELHDAAATGTEARKGKTIIWVCTRLLFLVYRNVLSDVSMNLGKRLSQTIPYKAILS
jgi:hypothetical protein